MPLNLDMRRALRTLAEFIALGEAIRDAPTDEPETDYVEWKGAWDLTKTENLFHTARHILAFGNRSVVSAEAQFEGCAYFVAGVEPGAVHGSTVLDPAELDDRLSKYVLPGQPRWSPHYVTLAEGTILVIAIEAPREGDPIFTLQREYGKYAAGRIFVRRHGKSEEARPADVRALEARGHASRPRVELSVTRADPGTVLRPIDYPTDAWQAWMEAEVATLLASLNTPVFKTVEPRSKLEFRDAVACYEEGAEIWWRAFAAKTAVDDELAPLELSIINQTDRNFADVEVVLTLPGGIEAWRPDSRILGALGAPKKPAAWGSSSFAAAVARRIYPTLPLDRGGRPVITDHGTYETVTFPAVQVRPGTPVRLDEIDLLIPKAYAGQTIAISWVLTSTDADGRVEGSLAFDVAAAVAPVVPITDDEF